MLNFLVILLLTGAPAEAKLRVVTTVSDLASLSRELGGDAVEVESLAKGTQDPHFIEPKPSYMVKLGRADLLIAMGLDLEVGWLPSLILGARNPKVKAGEKGYLELGASLDPLEVARGKVSRAEGDVHPAGNPHFHLDPIRMAKAASLIADRLAELDPAHAPDFAARARAFTERMKGKTEAWKKRIEKSGVKRVVTYHKTLTYFFDRFGIENSAYLEPKPGIPPTGAHLLEVVRVMKDGRVPLILVENFFDASVTKKITGEVPGARAESVAVYVDGAPGIARIDDLLEQIVLAIEGKK